MPALWGLCSRRVIAPRLAIAQRRLLHQSSLNTTAIDASRPLTGSPASSDPTPDIQFEILGSTFSLLSVSLGASQELFARRGCLAAVSGKTENISSTLSVLSPFRRFLSRIPFLYQRISSTTPITALISSSFSSAALTTLHLDGSQDWILARESLLAWSGQRLQIDPYLNTILPLAYRGTTLATGRGLVALAGRGTIIEVKIANNEHYAVHPSHILAYTLSSQSPAPLVLKSRGFSFDTPDLSRYLARFDWYKAVRQSPAWTIPAGFYHSTKLWLSTLIWGNQALLNFTGPATLLLQSRNWKLNEIFSDRQIRELQSVVPDMQQRPTTQSLTPLAKVETNVLPVVQSTIQGQGEKSGPDQFDRLAG